MNTRGLIRHPASILLVACAVIPLLLSSCKPGNASTSLPPAQPTATTLPAQPPTAVPVALPTQAPAPAATQPAASTGAITLDLSGVAQDQTIETVAGVPASAGAFWTTVMPQYRLLTLQGYPVASHSFKPQIFIYPAGELASANENAGKVAANLQALLQTRQPGDELPFLPLINAKQVIHPQVQYLDFQNGKGARFLTWYSQGMVVINNAELIYTFQGLTSDGKFYIAAVLPVTHPDLPATSQVFAQTEEGLKEYPAYLTKTAGMLEQQPGGSFTPDLAKLDALVQSIEVK